MRISDWSSDVCSSDLVGIRPEDIPANGLSIGETISAIDTNRSWAVLKNIESEPDYRQLLMALLDELKPVVEPRTGAMLTPQGFAFISAPRPSPPPIGREAFRERACPYVENSGVSVSV